MSRNAGFTILELMVASAILIVVMAYVTQSLTVQQKTYTVVDQVTEAQQNLRAASDLLARDVRRAGYMVPPHAAVCGYDEQTDRDTLFVSDADAIRSVFDLEGGNEDLAGVFGALVTGTNSTWTASGANFDLVLENLWVDVAADGSDFTGGAGVIVVNQLVDDGLVGCGVIGGITGNTVTVNFDTTQTGPVGLNARVLAVPAHVYQVTGDPPQLRRNGVLLATDVEDFQVTYFFDLNGDLIVDANETFGSATGIDRPWQLTPAANRPDYSTLTEIGLNLVTRTRDDDPNRDYTQGAGQLRGNRTAASLPTGDGKRRRVYSARVRLRNAR